MLEKLMKLHSEVAEGSEKIAAEASHGIESGEKKEANLPRSN